MMTITTYSILKTLYPGGSIPIAEFESASEKVRALMDLLEDVAVQTAREPQPEVSVSVKRKRRPSAAKPAGHEPIGKDGLRDYLAAHPGPHMPKQLAKDLHVGESTVYYWARKLKRMVRKTEKGFEYKHDVASLRKGRARPVAGDLSTDKVLRALSTGPADYKELASVLGLPGGTVSSALHVLARDKRITFDQPTDGRARTYRLAS